MRQASSVADHPQRQASIAGGADLHGKMFLRLTRICGGGPYPIRI